jgi:hypothetical protein
VHTIDAPVSGGIEGARTGDLTMLVGVAIGGKVIKCPFPLNVLKYTCDRSCY